MEPLTDIVAVQNVASAAQVSTGRTTRVAVAQMTAVGSPESNFQTCSTLAEEAAAQGCKMLFLPENFNFLGRMPAESLSIAQALDGNFIQQYCQLARRLGLWLSLGGFQEKGLDPQHLFNCHVIMSDQGEVVATYRKVVACNSPAGRLGLSICYDLRFPELYQRLTYQEGAQVLLVPSAFTVATGKAHWEVLLRARAIECQSYVIAAAQAGRHNEKRESYGHSLIIDPWGEVVGRLEDPLSTGIAVADIDLGKLKAIRARMPIEQHRKLGRECLGWD
ncbi:hypothetical protein N2152v2_008811 [Parachlorella kessleri]